MTQTNQLANDKLLMRWIDNEFRNKNTQKTYISALRLYKKNLGIEDLSDYLESKPDLICDMTKFLRSLEGKPSKSINTYAGAVKNCSN